MIEEIEWLDEFVDRIIALGYDEDTASDIAVEIGDTPPPPVEGMMAVSVGGKDYQIPEAVYYGEEIADEVKAYDPNQKRGEAGTPQGGRWVKEDGAKSQKEKTIERFGDEASSMMRKLKENEGFTLNLDGTDELSGYAVSIDKSSERVFDELTEDNLEDYIREFWDDLTLEGRHLGGWYNKADNKIYLDVPIIVDDFDTATRLASENDQIAFFHLDTFTEYQTDEAIRQIKERQ